MTTQETILILAVLKAAYPASFKGMSRTEGETAVQIWTDMFAGDSYPAVSAAVRHLIETRQVGYTPTVAEVKAALAEVRAPTLAPAGEWDYRYAKLNALRKRIGLSTVVRGQGG